VGVVMMILCGPVWKPQSVSLMPQTGISRTRLPRAHVPRPFSNVVDPLTKIERCLHIWLRRLGRRAVLDVLPLLASAQPAVH
jgi:hypothetical protein